MSADMASAREGWEFECSGNQAAQASDRELLFRFYDLGSAARPGGLDCPRLLRISCHESRVTSCREHATLRTIPD